MLFDGFKIYPYLPLFYSFQLSGIIFICTMILPCAITRSVTYSVSPRRLWHRLSSGRCQHILLHSLQLMPPCLQGASHLSSCLGLIILFANNHPFSVASLIPPTPLGLSQFNPSILTLQHTNQQNQSSSPVNVPFHSTLLGLPLSVCFILTYHELAL